MLPVQLLLGGTGRHCSASLSGTACDCHWQCQWPTESLAQARCQWLPSSGSEAHCQCKWQSLALALAVPVAESDGTASGTASASASGSLSRGHRTNFAVHHSGWHERVTVTVPVADSESDSAGPGSPPSRRSLSHSSSLATAAPGAGQCPVVD